MRISIFGLGYVGTVTAACLARDGHSVIGVDVNEFKVSEISEGRSPVVEPQLDALIEQATANGVLTATTDAERAVVDTELSLICVGTPSNDNGSLKLTYVQRVCENIGRAISRVDRSHTVVVRSTVVPGTTRNVLLPILQEHSGREAGPNLKIAMNPEFLREGSAVDDYYQPSYIVIGENDKASGDEVQRSYEAVDAPVVRTSIESAEMVKYVNNAFHALKVVFANEVGNLCKAHQIDGREVMDIFCQDHRLNISPAYLKPGFAFGGSCLPKDLRALLYAGRQRDIESPVLQAVLASNQKQVARGIEMVERTGLKRVGVLGLSFKAGTDDVRESPVVPLVETLVGRGYDVRIFDETLNPERLIGANKAFLERELPHIATLMRRSIDEVVADSEVLVVTNSSPSFQQALGNVRQDQTVIDLVGSFDGNGKSTNENYKGIGW